MITRSAQVIFALHQSLSLKDKRQVCRSLLDKTKRKFNACVAEVDSQDRIGVLTLGVAVVSGEPSHAAEMLENVIRYWENNEDAEVISVERDPG